MVTIKEVSDIRINGKTWKNCNGKKLNSLTINDITYKLKENNEFVYLMFSSLNGEGKGRKVVPVPKNSNISISSSAGSDLISIYLNGNSKPYTEFNLTFPDDQIFMELDVNNITNIQEYTDVKCMWGNIVATFDMEESATLFGSNLNLILELSNAKLGNPDYLSINELNKLDDYLWSKSGSRSYSYSFKYTLNKEDYSVFVNDSLYTYKGSIKSYRNVNKTSTTNYTLKVVDYS